MESRYMRRKRLGDAIAREIAQSIISAIIAVALILANAPTWGWIGIGSLAYLIMGISLAVRS